MRAPKSDDDLIMSLPYGKFTSETRRFIPISKKFRINVNSSRSVSELSVEEWRALRTRRKAKKLGESYDLDFKYQQMYQLKYQKAQ